MASWNSAFSSTSGTSQIKYLSKSKQKRLATKLVSKFLKREFLQKAELPFKFVLAEWQLEGHDLNTTPQEFTDRVLNALIAHPKILVVNQDLKIDLSLDYHLKDYLSEYQTRKKGIFLGADYIIVGTLRSYYTEATNNKPKKTYSASITIKAIRTDEVILREVYTLGEK